MRDEYDSGNLADFGGGNVEWWQDYVRSEVGAANDFHADAIESMQSNNAKLEADKKDLKARVAELEAIVSGKDDEIESLGYEIQETHERYE